MKPVVTHVITGLNTGGAELMLSRLMDLHGDSAFSHRVVCLTDEGPVADTIRAAGVPVRNLNMARGLPNPIAIRRLARMIAADRASVVQTWLYHADLIGGLAGRMAGVPVAWGIHHSRLDPETTSRSLRMTVRAGACLSSRVPTAIICCAEASRVAHIEHGYAADRMVVIPNGFDVRLFRPDSAARSRIRTELGIPEDHLLVGIAGRFVSLKNHRMFVEAAGQLRRSRADVHFVMAGDGLHADNPELSSWIEDAAVTDRMHLLGRRQDLNQVLAALDVCTLTSRTEAFPLVIGEAMATGIPCVATDVGDASYLIADTGRIVPSNDVSAFVAASEISWCLIPASDSAWEPALASA